ncbi:MAG: hypothetical protein GY874_12980 [Desulfobacteraceae bacterium]|nr:hypothetical protein [Desulfobacteraceae bacterium]
MGTDDTITLEINAFDYDDGDHSLAVTASDELNNTTTIELSLSLANAAKMEGYGVDAVICNGTVTVYSWKDGTQGALIGTGKTNNHGFYSLDLKVPKQPVLLKIQGGYYIEEASGRKVSLEGDQALYAVAYYPGEDLEIMITPWTTVAAGLAKYYVKKMGAENAITAATSALTGLIGVNVLETYPINITDPAGISSNLSDGHLYGFFTAALSSWTAQISEHNGLTAHTVYNSIALGQLMYNDIAYDGALNGYGITPSGFVGHFYMGSYALNAGNYRQMIGHHILKAADADYNQTGLEIVDLLDPAYIYSQRINALFDHEDPLPLDAQGPKAYQTEALGKYYSGKIRYPFKIKDPVGIESLSVDFDGDALDVDAPVETEAIVTVAIDTADYEDGVHTLTIVAEDKLGNESETKLSIKLNNTGILLNYTSAALTNKSPYILTGTYEETVGGDIQSLTVNGHDAAVNTSTCTWSYVAGLGHGYNDFEITATDDINNETTLEIEVVLDQISATIDTSAGHSEATFLYSDEAEEISWLEDKNIYYPVVFSFYNINLGSTSVTESALDGQKIPYFSFDPYDPPDNGSFTADEDLKVTLTYKINNIEKSSRTLYPISESNQYIIPMVLEYMHDDFASCSVDDIHTFVVTVTDEAGNKAVKSLTFKAFVNTPQLFLSSATKNSTVNVYAFDDAITGGRIATGKTDQYGQATIDLLTYERPLLIEITGGKYIEYGSGYTINIPDGKTLEAVIDFDQDDVSASVTPLTHAAVGCAQYFVRRGYTAADAVNAGNDSVSGIFSVDVLGTPLVDITDKNNAIEDITDEYRYSFILAGLSNWAHYVAQNNNEQNMRQYNSISLAQILRRDAGNDCRFNGGEKFGGVSVNQDVYKNQFADSVLAVIASEQNQTGLDAQDFVNIGVTAANSADEAVAFDILFANRASLINKEIYATDYSFSNSNGHRVLIKYTVPGTHSLAHKYFSAIKSHRVRETKTYKYRAAAWRLPTSRTKMYNGKVITVYENGPETELNDWKAITSYEIFKPDNPVQYPGFDPPFDFLEQQGRWETVIPKKSESRDFFWDSDTFPNNTTTPGYDAFLPATMDYVVKITKTGSRWRGNYRIAASGNYRYAWQVRLNTTLVAGPLPEQVKHYNTPPKIQRYATTTYETLSKSTNRSNFRKTFPFTDNRYVLTDLQSNPLGQLSSYYVIAENKKASVQHYVKLPNVTLYSSGSPGYTKQTFDQALSWTLQKDLNIVVVLGGDGMDQISQMPHYKISTDAAAVTYSLTKS